MAAAEEVHFVRGQIPPDYHCACAQCRTVIGELIRPEPWPLKKDGSPDKYYNRNERRQYYSDQERVKKDPETGKEEGHIAKTPLHIARWAVQQYSQPGDWVLDPTIGAGTTAVEAITQGRSVAGMELEYGKVLEANVRKALDDRHPQARPDVRLRSGDARDIELFLEELSVDFRLVVSNPPYGGDESMPSPAKEGRGKEHREKEIKFKYTSDLPNLAFLPVMSDEYRSEMARVYEPCVRWLADGGHFVVGVKDMVKNKQPLLIHQVYTRILTDLGLTFVGTAFLKHHPGTLFLNSYEKMHGAKPPCYQTITVFKK
jgi:DNA modification methylase